MTLTQINSLLAVLDYGGFTEASKRLFMTQSAVSQAIAALEQELGVNILLRDRRKAMEGANKRGNSSRLTQSFHFFMFEPIFSPVNALNQPI